MIILVFRKFSSNAFLPSGAVMVILTSFTTSPRLIVKDPEVGLGYNAVLENGSSPIPVGRMV